MTTRRRIKGSPVPSLVMFTAIVALVVTMARARVGVVHASEAVADLTDAVEAIGRPLPPPVHQPPGTTFPIHTGATTDCGLRGAPYTVRAIPPDGTLATARLRLGPCVGASSVDCDDNKQSTCPGMGHRKRCIAEEFEGQWAYQWAEWKLGEQPNPHDVTDFGVVCGMSDRLKAEYDAAHPAPQPSPTPSATPPPPVATPTPAPTPQPCEACPIPPAVVTALREAEAALEAMPSRHGVQRVRWQTVQARDNALRRIREVLSTGEVGEWQTDFPLAPPAPGGER